MRRAAKVFVLAGLLSTAAWASNIYSVAYEGNGMPESEPGWYRVHGGGDPWGPSGAIRTIETDPDDPNNHFLVINSLASQMIYDYAYYPRQMDPDGPFERYYSEWRALVSVHYGAEEQGLYFIADNDNWVAFTYGYDSIYSWSDEWSMPIEPGVFHTYYFESASMVSYSLWIDGELAHNGSFFEGLPNVSQAGFGDQVQGGGARSLVKYDYVRFGVYQVPEAASLGLLLGLGVLRGRRRCIG